MRGGGPVKKTGSWFCWPKIPESNWIRILNPTISRNHGTYINGSSKCYEQVWRKIDNFIYSSSSISSLKYFSHKGKFSFTGSPRVLSNHPNIRTSVEQECLIMWNMSDSFDQIWCDWDEMKKILIFSLNRLLIYIPRIILGILNIFQIVAYYTWFVIITYELMLKKILT